MALLGWDSFVQRCRTAAGFSVEMAAGARQCFKEGWDGKHLDGVYRTMVASLREMYPGSYVDITDIVIANVVARNVGSESHTERLLSRYRQIFRRAFGALPQLQYDRHSTQLLRGQAMKIRKKKPKYSRPVDFGGERGV
jgi:hypothetical protein